MQEGTTCAASNRHFGFSEMCIVSRFKPRSNPGLIRGSILGMARDFKVVGREMEVVVKWNWGQRVGTGADVSY